MTLALHKLEALFRFHLCWLEPQSVNYYKVDRWPQPQTLVVMDGKLNQHHQQ
jgi:hypothetical protein